MGSIRGLPCDLRRAAAVIVIIVLTPAAGRAVPATVTMQQAALSGTVQDGSGNALAGATVRVPAAGRAVVSDADGRFRITDLAAGEHTVTAAYIGYSDATRTVRVGAGESVVVEIVMEASAVALAGITVYGELTRGQARALNEQKTSPNLQYVIDEELFDLYPDINAAETVQRLPGVSIARDQGEGRYVQVRGLGEQLNSLTLNGVRIPSIGRFAERSAELDIIPSSLIEAISVTKAMRPDMDGDALGGVVDLRLKSAGARPHLDLDLGGGWNDQQSEIDNWGNRIVSFSGSAGRRLVDDRLGILVAGSYHDTERGSLFESWRYVEDEGSPLARHRTTDYDVGRKNMGAVGNIDYRYADGGDLAFAFSWHRYLEDEIRRLAVYNIGSATESRFTGNRVREQDVLFGQLAGDQAIGSARLQYEASWTEGTEDWPDITEFQWTRENPLLSTMTDTEIDALGALSTFDGLDTPLTLDYAFVYPTTVETSRQAVGADVTLPVGAAGRSSFKIGGRYTHADRTYLFTSARSFPVDPGRLTIDGGTFGLADVRFGDRRVTELEPELAPAFVPPDAKTNASSYDASENTVAGYVMNTTDWSDRFTTLIGVRVEHTRHEYLQFATGNEGDGDYTELLPSAHAIYRFTPQTQLRAAVSRGLSRPPFSDLVPVDRVDSQDLEVTRGNPGLTPTTAWSYDLMLERYSDGLGVLSAGVFYKRLEDPIATGSFTELIDGVEHTVFQPRNGGSASVFGIELATYQRLAALGVPLLRHFAVNANYTWNHSEADFGDDIEREYPLPNSPEHTGNVSLIYEHPGVGLTTVVAGNYRSYMWEKFEGSQLHSDIWTGEEFHLDVSLSKDWGHGLSTYLQLNNLTNEADREIEGEPSASYSRLHERESYSWWATFGVRVSR